MESTRQQKVARLLQKEISNVFVQNGKTLFGSSLITVTKVRVTPDLAIARVYLSLFGTGDKQKLFDDINGRNGFIRKKMVEGVNKQLRIMPTIEFYLDDSLDYQENIEKLLKQ